MNRACLAALVLLPGLVLAQDLSKVEIKATKLTDQIHMLEGRGGNMAVCVGKDGAFLIDDQFAPLTAKIQAAVKKLTEEPIRFVVNTHWHGDHTGGNENLGKAGAVIVAHENVRKRMSTEQFIKAFNSKVPPAPEAARPVVTFREGVTFHLNSQTIRVIHLDPAHTDGDSLVMFEEANVLHTGDIFFNGLYPFLDEGAGGSLGGMIEAAGTILGLVDDETKIVPGHGPLAKKADLESYRKMLVAVHEKIRALKAEGKSLDEIVAAKPTSSYDPKWGNGFLKPEAWVRVVAPTVKAAKGTE